MASFDKGYALIIGIAGYPKIQPLPEVILNDARDLKAILTDSSQCGYPPRQVRRLLDEAATADNIRNGLHWLSEKTGRGDTAIIFFSGHGGRIENEAHTRNYLLPYDTDPANLAATAIEGAELTTLLHAIKAERLLALFDACYAGGTGETKGMLDKSLPEFKSGLDEQYYAQLAAGEGRVIIASSRSTEVSWILPDWRNSLFTHYLLEALRGEAHPCGSGQICVTEVFSFVAGKVPEHKPQHPILKTNGTTNFPIALYPGGKETSSKLEPAIENPKQIPLPDGSEAILQTIFAGRRRVVVKKRFQGGFSGGQVFLVRPIGANDLPELPGVVKLAAASLIQKEWQAYTEFVANRFPGSIRIEGKPAFLPQGKLGGLRYFLAGDGIFEMESFFDYCRQAAIEDIRFALKRLLEVMGQVWQFNQVAPQFHLYASYERYLPANLLIEVGPSEGKTPHALEPGSLKDEVLQSGDCVHLAGFAVSKVDLNYSTMDLNLPQKANALPASYTIRLKWDGPMPAYRVGQVIESIAGAVIETRQEKLETEARRALGEVFDLSSETVSWPGGPSLPNPLLAWPAILSETRDVKIASIHGDLNLENILVDPETRDVSLIDFADARRDHVLHDFLRLETEVVTKIIPPILYEHHLPPQTIYDLYRRLHLAVAHPAQGVGSPKSVLERPWAMLRAIREAAGNYLFKRDNWTEYYQGLAIYLLGAMKFGNLDRLAKQTAFWGSAVVGGGWNSIRLI